MPGRVVAYKRPTAMPGIEDDCWRLLILILGGSHFDGTGGITFMGSDLPGSREIICLHGFQRWVKKNYY